MTSVLGNAAGNQALTAILPPGCYLGLHVAPVSPDGTGEEVSGGGYGRQPISFAAPSGKTAVSNNAQSFPGMPACTVTHLAVWSAISGGSLRFFKQLATPIDVLASGVFLAAKGDVAVSV